MRIPISLKRSGSELFVVSALLPRTYLREPFFIDSLAKTFNEFKFDIKLPKENELLARPLKYDEKDPRIILTPFSQFIVEYNHAVKLNIGFIFHISRCGSTLATQMLSCNDRFFVLSEPTIINAVLDPALQISPNQRASLIRSSINALALSAPTSVERVFIKFRSWNTLYLNLILEQFQDVRWLFIHRHGLEVLPSVLRKSPGWLRSRSLYIKHFSKFLGISIDATNAMSDEEFVARMLGTFCKIASASKASHKAYLDYESLKFDFFDTIENLWNIGLDKTEKKQMVEKSFIYSKDINKRIKFIADGKEKRAEATKAQEVLIENYTEPERARLKLCK